MTSTSPWPRFDPSGIIAICGYWEPLAFLRRRGGNSVDDEVRYRAAHTEQMAEALAQRGINAVIWHGYKGLGFEHEQADMELTAQFGRHCGRRGIALGAYCNLGSFFAETMFQENPAAREWTAIDAAGQPQPYSEFYRNTYRWRPCMTHRSFIEYVKRAALHLVKHVGAQWIHFDNNAAVPCYTDRFQQHYRKHLTEKYQTNTPEGRARFARRYGFDTPQDVVLPRGSVRLGIDTMPAAQDPNLQEWIEYRCKLLTDAYHEITEAIKAARPDALVDLNPPMNRGEFVPLVWGVDVEGLSERGDFMYAEDGLNCRIGADGQLVGNFANYKFGHASCQRILTHQSGNLLDLFEAAVHNRGCLGRVAWADELPSPQSPVVRGIRFIRQHQELFAGTETLADVAVLRGRTAMVNNWAETFQSSLMIWQTLTRYGVQWDMVLDRSLNDLSKYKLLILPNTISLPDESMDCIVRYIESGGSVLAVQRAGQCDAWNRSRVGAVQGLDAENDEGLGLFRPLMTTLFSELLGVSDEAKRRVHHLPELRSPRPWRWNPLQSTMSWIGHEHWVLPENAEEVIDAVRTALNGELLVRQDKPGYVVPQLLRTRDSTVLHLLNYRAAERAPAGVIQLGFRVTSASALALDCDQGRDIELTRDGNVTYVHYPEFNEWQAIHLIS